ncbi:hypothetical protein ACEE23_10335 [Corynebacterium sp. 32222D000AT]|nr:hypothetical protein [Mycobacteriaceae bacterium]MDY5829994.1 hypothetical protein [Corynebacterium sp.]
MDFDALLAPALEFSSNGIGAVLRDVLVGLYTLLFPANSEAAHIID